VRGDGGGDLRRGGLSMGAIRNVEIDGRAGLDVRLDGGRIAAIAPGLAGTGEAVDGRGGALIPGLADHHAHLLALAAKAGSVALDDVASAGQLRARIAAAAGDRPAGAWIRAVGYHEGAAGDLSRAELDTLAPRHPLRLQHRTGALWVLNSLALAALGAAAPPPCVERGDDGAPTGRIWRGDAWLAERLGAEPPDLAPVGRQLAAYGVTAVTDASVTTDAGAAAHLAAARRGGDLPQRLTLMSGGPLAAPDDGAFVVGPVKVLLDDHALPALDDFVGRIEQARAWNRAVAVHCVTAAELALALAAFGAAGAQPGDRIEHGGVIAAAAIEVLRALRLTVVTQPAFVRERGDRYVAEVDPVDQPDLYRCASLLAAGVPVAASSDAPYGSPDPWLAIAAAAERRTRRGLRLGEGERVSPDRALGLYLGAPADPAGPPRRVAVGSPADLCLLDRPLREALAEPSADHVVATFVAGAVIHRRSPAIGR
jgi:predicted amidohydrolase YtcJ